MGTSIRNDSQPRIWHCQGESPNSSNVKLPTCNFTHLTNLRVQKKVLTLRGAFAFDTVPHWALKPHLARNGMQGSIINVANEMHKETNIAIYETKMEIENNI